MSIRKIEEPYVRVTENIRDYPQQLPTTPNSSIAGVIVAPTGPRLAMISNPTEFLKTYTVDGNVPRNAHTSFLNAYYQSFSSSLVLSRSVNTQATAGIGITATRLQSVKAFLNLGDNYTGRLKVKVELDNSNQPRSTFNIIKSYLVHDEDSYNQLPASYISSHGGWGTPGLEESLPWLAVEFDPVQANTLDINVEGPNGYTKHITYSSTSTVSLLTLNPEELEIPKLYEGIWSININGTTTSIAVGDAVLPEEGVEVATLDITPDKSYESYQALASDIETQLTTLDLGANDIKVIWSTAEECILFSWEDKQPSIKSIQVTVEDIDANMVVNSIEVYQSKITPVEYVSLGHKDLLYKGKFTLPYKSVLRIKFNSTKPNPWASETFAFIVGDMAYYHGPIDKSEYEDYSLIKLSSQDEFETSLNGMNGICVSDSWIDESTGDYCFEVNYSGEDSRPYLAEVNACIGIESIKFDDPEVLDESDIIFSIYATNPSATNDYLVKIEPTKESATFNLTLVEGNKSNTYLVSLFSDATDNGGSNIYIENLNKYDITLRVSVNQDLAYDTDYYNSIEEYYNDLLLTEAPAPISFGDSGLDLSACKLPTCLTNSLYVLEDQDIYDITYLAPFGITDIQFVKTMNLIGKANDWFQAFDTPYTAVNVDSIKRYCNDIPDDSNCIVLGPFDKNRGLLGWGFYLAASTLYYERIMLNKSTNREFAPVFDQTYGVVSYSDPVVEFGKEDRTKLLNLPCPVNYVIYSKRSGRYYINNNLTHQTMRNLASEENARRLINEIKRNTKLYVSSYISKTNTTTTRQSVTTGLESMIKSNFINTNYDIIDDFQVVCNELNNTVDIINANKLAVTVRVRFIGSIKYVDAVVDCFPLGVDFEQ